MIKRKGRWSSEAFRVYVRANMWQTARRVSEALEADGEELERQPGPGTDFG